ncbi:SDR family NAD(P)-dependent oxidoreductase [Rhodopila sp.]|uniref:SDR family NAD(P)-dependent oxidoreductase n=1 Tax=Rhodopila sp. TaxID=2480087 RepID=UPI003D11DA9D
MSRLSPAIACVVGASGGIGRAIAERLAVDPAYARVIAMSRRRPADWRSDDRRGWIGADILDEASLAAAAERIAADRITQAGRLTRIVVATGRLHGPGLVPEKSMRALSLEGLSGLFAVNAAGPALVAKHLLPLTPRAEPSLFAALSARVGSIGDNQLGGWYGYRASKAALNMLIRSLAIEHRRTRPLCVCVALHPGTVDTALSAPFQAGVAPARLFSPAQAAAALLAVMDGLGPTANGGFFAWDGAPIPW